MHKNTAITASAGMVLLASVATGALIISTQSAPASGEESPPTTAEIVVEYIDAEGNLIPVETKVVTEAPASSVYNETVDHEEYDDDHDEYEDDDDDHDEYEDHDDDNDEEDDD
ncbi:MAG: hypothetical protein V3V01_13255 [Acidimicrobiales bacterium]